MSVMVMPAVADQLSARCTPARKVMSVSAVALIASETVATRLEPAWSMAEITGTAGAVAALWTKAFPLGSNPA